MQFTDLINLPRRWQILIAIVIASGLNPLFLSLDDNFGEISSAIPSGETGGVIQQDMTSKLTYIREKGIWNSNLAKNNQSNESTAAESEIDSPPDEQEDANWRLVGLISTVNGTEAVLKHGNEYIDAIRSGDRLPSGERVVTLGEDFMILSTDGNDVRLALFPKSN